MTDAEIVARLRAEHVPVQRRMIDRTTTDLWVESRCEVCHVRWPCPTSRALGDQAAPTDDLSAADNTAPQAAPERCPTCGGKVRSWKQGTPSACPDPWHAALPHQEPKGEA